MKTILKTYFIMSSMAIIFSCDNSDGESKNDKTKQLLQNIEKERQECLKNYKPGTYSSILFKSSIAPFEKMRKISKFMSIGQTNDVEKEDYKLLRKLNLTYKELIEMFKTVKINLYFTKYQNKYLKEIKKNFNGKKASSYIIAQILWSSRKLLYDEKEFIKVLKNSFNDIADKTIREKLYSLADFGAYNQIYYLLSEKNLMRNFEIFKELYYMKSFYEKKTHKRNLIQLKDININDLYYKGHKILNIKDSKKEKISKLINENKILELIEYLKKNSLKSVLERLKYLLDDQEQFAHYPKWHFEYENFYNKYNAKNINFDTFKENISKFLDDPNSGNDTNVKKLETRNMKRTVSFRYPRHNLSTSRAG